LQGGGEEEEEKEKEEEKEEEEAGSDSPDEAEVVEILDIGPDGALVPRDPLQIEEEEKEMKEEEEAEGEEEMKEKKEEEEEEEEMKEEEEEEGGGGGGPLTPRWLLPRDVCAKWHNQYLAPSAPARHTGRGQAAGRGIQREIMADHSTMVQYGRLAEDFLGYHGNQSVSAI
jgi:hypothetical protein